ncbi:MAG: hypothetical protein ACE5GU_13395 [Candidatus Scalinduaceae bacterium]
MVVKSKKGNKDKVVKAGKADKRAVDIKVLKKQLKALKDEYKLRSESLEKVLSLNESKTEKILSSNRKSMEKRFATIILAFGLIFTFTIGGFVYFSENVITKWAENKLTKFSENKAQRVIDDFAIYLGERSNNLEQEISKVLTEIEKKGERSLHILVSSLRKDESLKRLINSVSVNVKGMDESEHVAVVPEETIEESEQSGEKVAQVKNVKGTDESEHVAAVPEETIEESEQSGEKVAQVKTKEDELSYNERSHKGLLEDYNMAIESWDNTESDR